MLYDGIAAATPEHDGGPTHLPFRGTRILHGGSSLPDPGGADRVRISRGDVSAWTVRDIGSSDQ